MPNDLYISHSQMELLKMCPHKYYRRYILKEPDVFGAPLILGRAFHEALEHNFLHRIECGVDLGAKEIAKIFRDCFDREANLPEFTDLEDLQSNQVNWAGEDPAELRTLGQRTLLRYHRQHVPFLDPSSVELRLEREVAPGVMMVGLIDLITTQGVVIDYKTVAYPWREDRTETALQPTCYALLLDEPVTFDYHFITRATAKKSVGISIRRTIRTQSDIDWLVNTHIPDVVEIIKNGPFLRNVGPQCITCAQRLGCGYRT